MVARGSYPFRFRFCIPYTADSHPRHLMPDWPIPDGCRCITAQLRIPLVEHLDARADYLGCSRAAYLRQLILDDIKRQGRGRASAKS